MQAAAKKSRKLVQSASAGEEALSTCRRGVPVLLGHHDDCTLSIVLIRLCLVCLLAGLLAGGCSSFCACKCSVYCGQPRAPDSGLAPKPCQSVRLDRVSAVAPAECGNSQICVVPVLLWEVLGLSGLLHAQPAPVAGHHLVGYLLYVCLAGLLLVSLHLQ